MSRSTISELPPWVRVEIPEVRARLEYAYAPYSDFQVSAAVKTTNGSWYYGVNVENATYGATTCAERNAVAAAVGTGARQLEAVVIATRTKSPKAPCGICRQVLLEFSADLDVFSVSESGEVAQWKLSELLPESFSSSDLE